MQEGNSIPQSTSLVSLTTSLEQTRNDLRHIVTEIEQRIGGLALLVKGSIVDIVDKAKSILSEANAIAITNDESLNVANQYLVELAPCIKRVEGHKADITKDIKAKAREIDNTFKLILDPLTAASDNIRRKAIIYRREQQEAAQQVKAILQEANIPTPIVEIITPSEQKSNRVDGGIVSYTPTWDFEIQAVENVPYEILLATVRTARGREALESVIRARVKSGVRVIEGVRVFPTEQPRVLDR